MMTIQLTQKTMSKTAKLEIKNSVPTAHTVKKIGRNWIVRDIAGKMIAIVSKSTYIFNGLELNVL